MWLYLSCLFCSRYLRYKDSLPGDGNEKLLFHGTANHCDGAGCIQSPCGLCGILSKGFLPEYIAPGFVFGVQRFGRLLSLSDCCCILLISPQVLATTLPLIRPSRTSIRQIHWTIRASTIMNDNCYCARSLLDVPTKQ